MPDFVLGTLALGDIPRNQDDLGHLTSLYIPPLAGVNSFEGLQDTAVGVNFDASNQLMTGEDPLPVLEAVKHKVWHMHASDRLPGECAALRRPRRAGRPRRSS